jgi:hypothetical protein
MLSERTIPAWVVAIFTALAGIFLRVVPIMPVPVKRAVAWPFYSFSLWYLIVEIFRLDADIRAVVFRANLLALCLIIIYIAHTYIQRVGGYRALWLNGK